MNFIQSIQQEIQELVDSKDVNQILSFDTKLDSYFNLEIEQIEKTITDNSIGVYAGVDHRALLTSYVDYYKILKRIPLGEILVDLGAGYCRGTLLSTILNELGSCVSYEFIAERAKGAISYLNAGPKVIIADLLQVEIIEAFAYYLYFPRGIVLDRILRKLWHLSKNKNLTLYVCESHGDVLEYLDSLSILFRFEEIDITLPRYYPKIVGYKFNINNCGKVGLDTNLSQWLLFNRDKDYVFIIRYFYHQLQTYVQWLVPVSESQWCRYNGSECLQLSSGRIIEVNASEPILDAIIVDDKTSALLKDPCYQKVFLHKGVFEFEMAPEKNSY